jgi:hypothetical protein
MTQEEKQIALEEARMILAHAIERMRYWKKMLDEQLDKIEELEKE